MACIAVYLLFLLSYSYPLIPCRQEPLSSPAGSSNPAAGWSFLHPAISFQGESHGCSSKKS
ncbi:hypothetical protein CORC01_01684 [Colletotrichum orchidophilum]|uniref:Uncharacterized protein n=1 Tax=Colletotrichum orchidophilum TaxID=1209926 RepID=A0A1G4BNQ8_9PEZI|nr:uncharacterized protein CORC01_01684 [Colletotrichum orchidophilum]OHF02926.1 hypothetical protein CORC01_01684 [Colletotrichum orchidophilum]